MMNISKKLLLNVTMIAGLGVISGLIPVAAHGGDKGSHHLERMFKGFDLTELQSTEISQLMKAHHANRLQRSKEQIKQQREQHREQLKAWFDSPTLDQQALEARIVQRQDKRQQKTIAKMKLQHAIYQLLDPKQQQQYLATIGKTMVRMHHGERRHSIKDRSGH